MVSSEYRSSRHLIQNAAIVKNASSFPTSRNVAPGWKSLSVHLKRIRTAPGKSSPYQVPVVQSVQSELFESLQPLCHSIILNYIESQFSHSHLAISLLEQFSTLTCDVLWPAFQMLNATVP